MLRPPMQSKLCLLLALLVLIGVLVGGNPFLPSRSAAASSEPGPQPTSPTYALSAPAPNAPAPDAQLVGLPASGSSGRPAVALPAEECPNVALRAEVVKVLHDAGGQPIWVLRDGRALRLDPTSRLLVAATLDSGKLAAKPRDASR